jgi:hypothetical protein
MWEMLIFAHKYIIVSSIPFQILKTSVGTQIMLQSQFLDFYNKLEIIRIII